MTGPFIRSPTQCTTNAERTEEFHFGVASIAWLGDATSLLFFVFALRSAVRPEGRKSTLQCNRTTGSALLARNASTSSRNAEGIMSIIERVLEPDSTETPTCICGNDMRLARVEPHGSIQDAETREFDCGCGHRLKLVLWAS
jgi:hypothetical protein